MGSDVHHLVTEAELLAFEEKMLQEFAQVPSARLCTQAPEREG